MYDRLWYKNLFYFVFINVKKLFVLLPVNKSLPTPADFLESRQCSHKFIRKLLVPILTDFQRCRKLYEEIREKSSAPVILESLHFWYTSGVRKLFVASLGAFFNPLHQQELNLRIPVIKKIGLISGSFHRSSF